MSSGCAAVASTVCFSVVPPNFTAPDSLISSTNPLPAKPRKLIEFDAQAAANHVPPATPVPSFAL
jgi:hypothetical protein